MTDFLVHLKKYRTVLTAQQYRTLKGQAIAGDVVGATKGLIKVLSRVENTLKYKDEQNAMEHIYTGVEVSAK